MVSAEEMARDHSSLRRDSSLRALHPEHVLSKFVWPWISGLGPFRFILVELFFCILHDFKTHEIAEGFEVLFFLVNLGVSLLAVFLVVVVLRMLRAKVLISGGLESVDFSFLHAVQLLSKLEVTPGEGS